MDDSIRGYEDLVMYNLEAGEAMLTKDNDVDIFIDGNEKFRALMELLTSYIDDQLFSLVLLQFLYTFSVRSEERRVGKECVGMAAFVVFYTGTGIRVLSVTGAGYAQCFLQLYW